MTDEFIQPLLAWYDENKRILPWRDKHNAYYTWCPMARWNPEAVPLQTVRSLFQIW